LLLALRSHASSFGLATRSERWSVYHTLVKVVAEKLNSVELYTTTLKWDGAAYEFCWQHNA